MTDFHITPDTTILVGNTKQEAVLFTSLMILPLVELEYRESGIIASDKEGVPVPTTDWVLNANISFAPASTHPVHAIRSAEDANSIKFGVKAYVENMSCVGPTLFSVKLSSKEETGLGNIDIFESLAFKTWIAGSKNPNKMESTSKKVVENFLEAQKNYLEYIASSHGVIDTNKEVDPQTEELTTLATQSKNQEIEEEISKASRKLDMFFNKIDLVKKSNLIVWPAVFNAYEYKRDSLNEKNLGILFNILSTIPEVEVRNSFIDNINTKIGESLSVFLEETLYQEDLDFNEFIDNSPDKVVDDIEPEFGFISSTESVD